MRTRQVREFTRATQTDLPDRPVQLSLDRVDFVRRMVADEMQELGEARDVTEQADALVDAIYYLMDTAVRHGIDLDPLFDIVHRANMGKVVNGSVLRRADGKILKPEGWVDPAPFLRAEVLRQQNRGAWQD